MRSNAATPWLVPARSLPNPPLRLLCYPYAGGSAAGFREWPALLPASVEVIALQPPGRASRRAEPPFRRLTDLVPDLADAVEPLLDRPFALAGHSLGALVSFELARELIRRGRPAPRHLFVSAHRAPHLPRRTRVIYDLPDDQFLAEIKRLNGTPAEILAEPELLELVLPTLKADFEALQTYEHAEGPPLPSRITAFGGFRDPLVNRDEMDAWRRHTAADFALHVFAGDHFFIDKLRSRVLQIVAADLDKLLAECD